MRQVWPTLPKVTYVKTIKATDYQAPRRKTLKFEGVSSNHSKQSTLVFHCQTPLSTTSRFCTPSGNVRRLNHIGAYGSVLYFGQSISDPYYSLSIFSSIVAEQRILSSAITQWKIVKTKLCSINLNVDICVVKYRREPLHNTAANTFFYTRFNTEFGLVNSARWCNHLQASGVPASHVLMTEYACHLP